MKQLEFTDILDHSFRRYERDMTSYLVNNRDFYLGSAERIKPAFYSEAEIYSRLAFAMLSANCSFEQARKALTYVTSRQGRTIDRKTFIKFGMVPVKIDFVSSLFHSDLKGLLKADSETWSDYRMRLCEVRGLGLAKASFGACLLYPTESDLACIDTWIYKIFKRFPFNRGNPRIDHYLFIEEKIRGYAEIANVNTFVAQWSIWDFARKTVTNHDIF
jgi:thermostable 8-oxoguanine DNA glycosylase